MQLPFEQLHRAITSAAKGPMFRKRFMQTMFSNDNLGCWEIVIFLPMSYTLRNWLCNAGIRRGRLSENGHNMRPKKRRWWKQTPTSQNTTPIPKSVKMTRRSAGGGRGTKPKICFGKRYLNADCPSRGLASAWAANSNRKYPEKINGKMWLYEIPRIILSPACGRSPCEQPPSCAQARRELWGRFHKMAAMASSHAGEETRIHTA